MTTASNSNHGFTSIVLVLILQLVSTTAWRPESLLSVFETRTLSPNNRAHSISGAIRNFRHIKVKAVVEEESEVEDDIAPSEGVNAKRLIEVTSEVKLPFSREVAFDAYSDLTRQPSWSSWLHCVEYTDESKEVSKWTMKFMGIKYSWTAIALRNDRPNVIQWQSTSGLKNFGMVKFLPHNDEKHPTLMTMRMTFVAPRAAAAIFRRSKAMANFVKDKMITDSMVNFRDVVLKTDLKESNEQADC